MDLTEHIGEWWLPDHPTHRVAGTLLLSREDGPILTLLGSLDDGWGENFPDQYSAILGEVLDVGLVTLRGCWTKSLRSSRTHKSGLAKTVYGAHWALLGDHIPQREAPRFHFVAVEVSQLTNWIGRSGLMTTWTQRPHTTDSNDEATAHDLCVSYLPPSSRYIDLGAVKVSIDPSMQREKTSTSVTLRNDYILKFSAREPICLREWTTQWIYPLVDFVTFATGVPSRIERMRTSIEIANPPEPDILAHPLDVWSFLRHRHLVPSDSRFQDQPVISFERASSRLDSVLNAWMDLHREIAGTLRLYLSIFYNHGRFPYTDAEFLSAVQAAESYHRRKRPGTQSSELNHQARIQRVLKSQTSKDRQWLKSRLRHSNEKNLEQRIGALVDETAGLFSDTTSQDPKVFAEEVARTRNFLTHYDPSLAGSRMSELETMRATQILLLVLRVQVVKDLGFTDAESNKMVRQSRAFSRIQNWVPIIQE